MVYSPLLNPGYFFMSWLKIFNKPFWSMGVRSFANFLLLKLPQKRKNLTQNKNFEWKSSLIQSQQNSIQRKIEYSLEWHELNIHFRKRVWIRSEFDIHRKVAWVTAVFQRIYFILWMLFYLWTSLSSLLEIHLKDQCCSLTLARERIAHCV